MSQIAVLPDPLGSKDGDDVTQSRGGSNFRIKGHFLNDASAQGMAGLLADHRRTIARGTIPSDAEDRTGPGCGRPGGRSGHARPAGRSEGTGLSQDLHDCGGYHLSLLQISLKLLEAFVSEGRGRVHLDRTKAQLARFAADLGSMARATATRPDADCRDLDAFLSETLDAWSAACGLPVDFQCNCPHLRLSAALEQPFLRVLQESLTNVLKHARTASRVAVGLSVRRGVLILTVGDDGCGFDPALVRPLRGGRRGAGRMAGNGVSAGMGLPGMAARMERIGGRLTVESTPGHGTLIRARLRLPPRP